MPLPNDVRVVPHFARNVVHLWFILLGIALGRDDCS